MQKKSFITDREYTALTDRAKATGALDFQKLVELGLLERKAKRQDDLLCIEKQMILPNTAHIPVSTNFWV